MLLLISNVDEKITCRIFFVTAILYFSRGMKRIGYPAGMFLIFPSFINSFQTRGAAPGADAYAGSPVPAGPGVSAFQAARGSPALRDSGELAVKHQVLHCCAFAHTNVSLFLRNAVWTVGIWETLCVCLKDYFDIVKNPMDLSTIKRKLDTGQYQEPWQYVDDVWLMFNNAWLYNRKTSRVYKFCTKLAEVFEQEIDPVMQSLGYCCGRKVGLPGTQAQSCFSIELTELIRRVLCVVP